MSHSNQEHAHGETVHHILSPTPLLIGIGTLVLYLGLAEMVGNGSYWLAILGGLLLLAAFVAWVREDVQWWPDTVVPTNAKDVGWYGMLFFLCTEITVFGSLFAVYFFRRPDFNPAFYNSDFLAFGFTAFNTAILVASSFTLHYAHNAIIKGNRKGLIIGTAITVLLGVVFLAGQVYEYVELIHHNFTFAGAAGIYGSIFYTLTGIHGLHVLFGVMLLTMLLVRALLGQYTKEKHVTVEVVSMYWHFVDVVWIALFVSLYVLPEVGM